MLVSVLGDSISTYEGYIPPNYKVYYDEDRQKINGLLRYMIPGGRK